MASRKLDTDGPSLWDPEPPGLQLQWFGASSDYLAVRKWKMLSRPLHLYGYSYLQAKSLASPCDLVAFCDHDVDRKEDWVGIQSS